MNAYLDIRRTNDRPSELRAEAANIRLARAAGAGFRHRLALRLQAWAARIDDGQRTHDRGGRGPGESPRVVPNLR